MGSCALKCKVARTKMGTSWLTLVMSSFFLLGIVQCQRPDRPGASERNRIESEPQDVLDTGVWLANWFLAIAFYAGRQERPWYRDYRAPSDDLPNIYIPNELTGNEIVRALKITGKEQMVVEENEYLDFLNFNLMQRDYFDFDVENDTSDYGYYGYRRPSRLSKYIDEEDGHFVFSEVFIAEALDIFQYPISNTTLGAQLGDNVIEAVNETLEESRVKKSHESWDDMIQDIDGQYQQMMSILEKKNLAKKTGDFYTITKSGLDLIRKAVNATVFQYEYSNRYESYDQFKAYKEFVKNIGQIIQSSASILHLPSEISWANIKATIQIMYKKAIPRVHLYQFLTKNLDYLEIDTDVKGMSKLSPSLTQQMVDTMWHIFGYGHPFRLHN